MPLSVERFELLKQAVMLDAPNIDMRYWHGVANLTGDKFDPCETSHCMAGLCDILWVHGWRDLAPWRAGERAAVNLGIDYVLDEPGGRVSEDCDAGKLFYTDMWPSEHQLDIIQAYESRDRTEIARAICRRIDSFVASRLEGDQEERGEYYPDQYLSL